MRRFGRISLYRRLCRQSAKWAHGQYFKGLQHTRWACIWEGIAVKHFGQTRGLVVYGSANYPIGNITGCRRQRGCSC